VRERTSDIALGLKAARVREQLSARGDGRGLRQEARQVGPHRADFQNRPSSRHVYRTSARLPFSSNRARPQGSARTDSNHNKETGFG
jgi:hypothetical protein